MVMVEKFRGVPREKGRGQGGDRQDRTGRDDDLSPRRGCERD